MDINEGGVVNYYKLYIFSIDSININNVQQDKNKLQSIDRSFESEI